MDNATTCRGFMAASRRRRCCRQAQSLPSGAPAVNSNTPRLFALDDAVKLEAVAIRDQF
jgi:hypothetical protein